MALVLPDPILFHLPQDDSPGSVHAHRCYPSYNCPSHASLKCSLLQAVCPLRVMVLNVYCYGSSVPDMQRWPINVCWINQNMITWMHKEGSQEDKNSWESSWALRTPWGPCASGSDGGIWLSNLEEAVLKALLPPACITDSTCPISQDPQGFLCEHLPSHWVRNRNGNNNHKQNSKPSSHCWPCNTTPSGWSFSENTSLLHLVS